MKNKFFFCYASIILLLICVLLTPHAYSFEPVSIDEFFKKYPDERPVQPTISESGVAHRPSGQKPKNSVTEFVEQDILTTAKQYPQVDVLLLDRISGQSEILHFDIGETKSLSSLFDITISECIERQTEFYNVTHAVKMTVNGYANSKASTPKSTLYDDIFYIEMPGFKGFQHAVYDIKPVKCLGKPQIVTLDEPVINNPSKTLEPKENKQDDKNSVIVPKDTKDKPNVHSQKTIEDIISENPSETPSNKPMQVPVAKTPLPVSVPLE